MDSTTHALDFPALLWAVVEQPPGARYPFDYRPEDGAFRETRSVSLFYDRGFSGAYGWVDGLGHPPGRHCDVILLTQQSPRPGDRMLAHTCGIFYRSDGDHKVVALDDALRATVAHPDLDELDATMAAELRACYPRLDPGEGWWDATEARVYLRRWDMAPALACPRRAPVWGPGSEGAHD